MAYYAEVFSPQTDRVTYLVGLGIVAVFGLMIFAATLNYGFTRSQEFELRRMEIHLQQQRLYEHPTTPTH